MKANEKLIMDMFRAVQERDLARLSEILTPDVEFLWPPSLPGYGGTYRGADVLDMQTAFAAVWDPVQQTDDTRRLSPRIVGSTSEEVVVLYHMRGADASGRNCDSEVLGLYRVVDGKVSRLQMFYFDPERVTAFLTSTTSSRSIDYA